MSTARMILWIPCCSALLACATPPVQQHSEDGGSPDTGVTTYCGDQAVDPGEECDDGNLLDGDGCGPACTVEPGWDCTGEPSVCVSLCGNGALDTGEVCDGANLGGGDCTTVPGGFTGGTLACTAGCQYDTTGCTLASCGNGVIDSGEECDDGNTSNTDACMNNCQSARCGDGYAWAGVEDCDDGNTSNTDACLNDCSAASCGDGYTQTGVEDCDDGNTSDTDACLVGCVSASCGDGHVWAGVEDCDDGGVIAGDGCSPACQTESLPVLYWATGQPAVWGSMTLTYAGDPHAPSAPIVAAANVDQRDRAYLFTTTSYHVLSLPGHQWIESGSISSRFPGVPTLTLAYGWGVSWSTDTESNVVLAVNPAGVGWQAYSYHIDNATGAVTLDAGSPTTIDFSSHTDPPPLSVIKAGYVDLANAHGWVVGDPLALCGVGNSTVGPNVGAFTTTDLIYHYEAGSCFEFYDHEPVSQFPPFTQSGAPAAADIAAAFYSTEHGDRLYLVTYP